MLRPALWIPIAAAFLIGCLFLSGCSDDGPSAPSPGGEVSGLVYLNTESGALEGDHRGVAIWIAGRTDTVKSDSLGRWALVNLPAGSWTVRLRKEGYGYRELRVGLDAGETAEFDEPVELVAEPSAVVSNWVWTYQVTPMNLILSATVVPQTPGAGALAFIGREPMHLPGPAAYIDTLLGTVPAGGGAVVFRTISLAAHPFNFSRGDTLYFRVTTLSARLGGHIDPVSGKQVYTTGISTLGLSSSVVLL